jgi:hypothetical protein
MPSTGERFTFANVCMLSYAEPSLPFHPIGWGQYLHRFLQLISRTVFHPMWDRDVLRVSSDERLSQWACMGAAQQGHEWHYRRDFFYRL